MTGKYYIGKTSCIGEPVKHTYYGGGVWIRNMAKHHGQLKNVPNHAKKSHFKNYNIKKYIIKTFYCESAAYIYENFVISDKWKHDDKCMNMKPGGEGGHKGILHPSYDDTIYKWVNLKGEVIYHTKNSLSQLLGEKLRSAITTCVNRNGKNSIHGWYFAGTKDKPLEPIFLRKTRKDTKKYRCYNIKLKIIKYFKRDELSNILGCSNTSIQNMINKGKSCKINTDWILCVDGVDIKEHVDYIKNNHKINGNNTIYKWSNKNGEKLHMTATQMRDFLECGENSVYRVVSGTRNSIKGWKIETT